MEKIGRLENNLAIFSKLEYKGYISFQIIENFFALDLVMYQNNKHPISLKSPYVQKI